MNPNSASLDQQEYIALLKKMGTILRRHGLLFPTKLVDGMITRLEAGQPPSILRDSNDVFGGMGSVSDCNLLSVDERVFVGPRPPLSVRQRDQKEFQTLIADLAERMYNDGIASPRVRDVGAFFTIQVGDKAKAYRIQPISFGVRKLTLWERIRRRLRGGKL